MKNFIKIIIIGLLALPSYAQQATEIDTKSVKLPRYNDLAAIQSAILSPQQGMMVFNINTSSFWYFNGAVWTNILGSGGSNWTVESDNIYRNSLVGINNNSPKTDLHVGTRDPISNELKGVIRAEGGMEIAGESYLAFGKNSPENKSPDEGKIGYNLTGKNALTIIGSNQIQDKNSQEKLWFEANWGSTFNGPLYVLGQDRETLFSVENNTDQVFAVTNSGLNIDTGPYGFTGTSLLNKNGVTNEAKWGFNNVGAEMLLSSSQNIAHATDTKINFGSVVFDHNNSGTFNGNTNTLNVGDVNNDNFIARAIGIYQVDFTVNWVDPDIDLGGTGLRNGRIKIKVNGVTRREFTCDLNIRERAYIKCLEGEIITVEAYHEHCFDPPPVCIVGIDRTISNARVAVMKF